MPTTSNSRSDVEIVKSAVRRAVIDHARGAASGLFENITNTTHRPDQLRFEGLVDFLPQPPDGDVDDVAVSVEGGLPHLLGDERAREHLTGGSRQQREERKLSR